MKDLHYLFFVVWKGTGSRVEGNKTDLSHKDKQNRDNILNGNMWRVVFVVVVFILQAEDGRRVGIS